MPKHTAVRLLLVFTIISLLLGLASIFCVLLSFTQETPLAADAEHAAPLIVLDPGHGGEDGGASSPDGTAEKDLNLSLALCTADMLRAAGFRVLLTREDDHMLYDLYNDLTDYTGRRKTYDLRNRLRFAEENRANLFVSIHMNLFPDPRYSGLQVYYSPNTPESAVAAGIVQNTARQYLQPQNNRSTKEATSSIYLLHRIRLPAILVECGFLSNPEECALLETETYRQQLALCLAYAIADSFTASAE